MSYKKYHRKNFRHSKKKTEIIFDSFQYLIYLWHVKLIANLHIVLMGVFEKKIDWKCEAIGPFKILCELCVHCTQADLTCLIQSMT